MEENNKFIRLEDKLDQVISVQADIRADLQEHMRRTELAEEGIEKLSIVLQPIQAHVAFIKGTGNLVAWILGIITAIATTYAALK